MDKLLRRLALCGATDGEGGYMDLMILFPAR